MGQLFYEEAAESLWLLSPAVCFALMKHLPGAGLIHRQTENHNFLLFPAMGRAAPRPVHRLIREKVYEDGDILSCPA